MSVLDRGPEESSLPPETTEERGAESRDIQRSPLALRPCSDCGAMVSQRASLCPHCGRSFHETLLQISYRGEHPVPVLVFFTLLAAVFALATPVLVQWAAYEWLSQSLASDAAWRLAMVVAAIYVFSMITCAVLGGAVGAPRMAYVTGLFLGLFFGPLGVFTAFALDKRPQCLHCYRRLDGLATECPSCHSRLTWEVETRWY